ncbi:MAG: ParB/RepB/Spo0J family partition protein [Thiovulaceae bacterium]|nr:ParB/RepB/Spo0J family partition protein [Sulfurimonadaceae bacterium]
MAKKKLDLNLAKLVSSSAHFNENNTDEFKGNVISKINIDFLQENPYQPRLEINSESLTELADSIEKNGLLQPITVVKINDQEYTIIYGHRRTAALKKLNKKYIDAIILDEVAHEQLSLLPLIENLQREDMNPIETAIAIKKILDEKIVNSQVDLAHKLGYSTSWLSRVLSILKLPEEIIKQIKIDGYNDIHVLSALNKIQSDHFDVYKKITNLTRTAAIHYIKNLQDNTKMAYIDNRVKQTKNSININTKGLSLTKRDEVNKILNKLKSILDS